MIKQGWQGNERGRREKKRKNVNKTENGNDVTDRPGVQVRVLLYLLSSHFSFSRSPCSF